MVDVELNMAVPPVQSGLLLEAVMTGAGFTTTVTLVFTVTQFCLVTVQVYVPACAAVMLGMLTDCVFAVNPFGPLH